MEESKEKLSFDDSTFDALEANFQEVLAKLADDKSLDTFRKEFEKLHRALHKSHESERRLMSKCRELNAEIVANTARVATALKLSGEDQATIEALRKEVDKAWKTLDVAQERENKGKETIESLRTEIDSLTREIQHGAGKSAGLENSLGDLVSAKEELTRERDRVLAEANKLHEQLKRAQDDRDRFEKDIQTKTEMIEQLQSELNRTQIEAIREQRIKERSERELVKSQEALEEKANELQSSQDEIQRLKKEIEKSDAHILELRAEGDKNSKEKDVLAVKIQKLEADVRKLDANNKSVTNEKISKEEELRQQEAELAAAKAGNATVTRLRDAIERKLVDAEKEKLRLDEEREKLCAKIRSLETEMETQRKFHERDKMAVERLTREHKLLKKEETSAREFAENQRKMVKAREECIWGLQQEIEQYKEEAQKQRKIIFELEKERDRYLADTADMMQKGLENLEKLKVREVHIFEYKKMIAEKESEFREKQIECEAVKKEMIVTTGSLSDLQDKLKELTRTVKFMTHQAEQLKCTNAELEATLLRERHDQQRLKDSKELLAKELEDIKKQVAINKRHIEAQEAEYRKLLKVIAEADQERLRQKKELDQVISERDILGTQLVRRNDELALLYEKIKIQQSILNKGEAQYAQRLEDIRVLKLEIRKLRREKALLQRNVANVDDMRREVLRLQSELVKERMRCRVLEEELESPVNVHRWRKLEANDPSTFEMVQKIAALQKRLIAKTEEVVEKELLIAEKERLFFELKQMLARQPGPEVAEQVSVYQNTLKEKTKQLKAMASELNMYESQIQEYKFEIERVSRELHDVKKKYYSQKRKEQLSKDAERSTLSTGASVVQPQNVSDHQQRFIGGGFNLSRSLYPNRIAAPGFPGGGDTL